MNNKFVLLCVLSVPIISAQSSPPPIVDVYSPQRLQTVSTFICDGTHVKIKYILKNNTVSVIEYVSGASKLSKREIDEWNFWLRPMRTIDSVQFLCSKSVSTIGFIGQSTNPDKDTVQVYVSNNDVRPMMKIEQ